MGAVCADNFETGTLSAICGGTTTILSFAKQARDERDRSLVDVIDEYHGEATGNSYCDYGFHLIITGTSCQLYGPNLKLRSQIVLRKNCRHCSKGALRLASCT